MRMFKVFLISVLLSSPVWAEDKTSSSIPWGQWDNAAFSLARQQNKLVLLDLVAVWCHWCHVMDAETYSDPAVAKAIEKNFIPVQADHDLRPDLAERYRDWGWPATIILDGSGNEVAKRAGYIDKASMLELLQTTANDPRPERAAGTLPSDLSGSAQLPASLRNTLMQRHRNSFDSGQGGLRGAQKFVDRDSVEWSLHQAQAGDKQEEARARKTLDAGLKLFDPEFGGVYQYSTHGDWNHPHYEKIMSVQTGYMRLYAMAGKQLNEPRYIKAAESIAAYMDEFLASPQGGYYTSQDADLVQGVKATDYFRLSRKQRLDQGIPRVDKHQYARENGLAVEALVALYQASGDARYLDKARQTAQWALHARPVGGGGFRHDKVDMAGPYLGDTLGMGRGFLALYNATNDAAWLQNATRAATFIAQKFEHPGGGLVSAVNNGTPVAPVPQIDENISAARFALDLAGAGGQAAPRQLAEQVLKYLNTPAIATGRITEGGILLADAQYTALAQNARQATR